MVVGPLPPPAMGPAVATEVMCRGLEAAGVRVVHVNTQDRRPVSKTNVLDLRNVLLALLHAFQTGWRAARSPVQVVYIPISQGRWGYARDALLMAIVRLLRRPYIVHLHGANLQSFYRSSRPLERRLIRTTLAWSQRAIALTPDLTRVYDGLVPPERLRVLENGIPDPWPTGVAWLHRERAERASQRPSALRILFVANRFPSKGAATVVRALAEPALRQARLHLVGDPAPEIIRRTEMLAEGLGVRERVEILGPRVDREKLREFEAADVFAYPTENDGQPLVVLEAMAAGLPVVASRCGGIPETLGDTGLLIEARDPTGLAEAVGTLIDDPELRDRLGRAARARYVSHYTAEHFQERLLKIFGEFLSSNGH
jgi:glycosyltransferase involved in cell wall biosynthesis